MSITGQRGYKACDRYMFGTGMMLHWGRGTTGTCTGCLYKPEVLTANDSYPYSPHPDWWWQKGRYSSAFVTQLLWLLLLKALQLAKEMKLYNSTNTWQQSARKAEILDAPSSFCSPHCCPYFPFPFSLIVFFLPELWYFDSPCDLQRQSLRNQWRCAVNSGIKCLTASEVGVGCSRNNRM